MFKLVLESGAPAGASREFEAGEVVIGRSHDASLRLDALDVSGRHCRIVVTDGKAVAENLSRFGTKLDGRPLTAPAPLRSGQRLTCGASTVLRFEEVPAAARPAPGPALPAPAAVAAVPHAAAPSVPAPAASAPPAAAGPAAAAPAAASVARASVPPESPGDETPTGSGRAAGDTPTTARPAAAPNARPAAPPPPAPADKPPASPEPPADEPLSVPFVTGEGGGLDRTRAMMTRIASPDEIEYLRREEYQRARGRLLMVVAGVALVAVAALVFVMTRPAPETAVAWPADAGGEDLIASVESPLGGFSVIYPRVSDAKITMQSGGLNVSCRVGRRRDVPLNITLHDAVDVRSVRETMEESIARWEAGLAREAGVKWSFDAPLPSALFFGDESGIPFKAIPYQREQDGSWSGVAAFFRHGRRTIAVLAEVPVADRLRAEDLLYTTFAMPSNEFVRTHWEGAPDVPKAAAAEILTRTREELRRVAPATWEGIRGQLSGALRRAVADENAEQEKEALELLAALRGQQALWFHDQTCKRLASLASYSDDETVNHQAHRIAELCKAVFSDPSDQRFYEVRKW